MRQVDEPAAAADFRAGAGIGLDAVLKLIKTAGGAIGRDADSGAGGFGKHRDRAAERGVADLRGGAGPTLDVDRTDVAGLEVDGALRCEVAWAARHDNSVKRGIDLVVLKTADAFPVVLLAHRPGRLHVHQARGELDQLVIVLGRDGAVVDEALADHRGRLGRLERCPAGCHIGRGAGRGRRKRRAGHKVDARAGRRDRAEILGLRRCRRRLGGGRLGLLGAGMNG